MHPVVDSDRKALQSLILELIVPTVVKHRKLVIASVGVALIAIYAAILYFSPLYAVSTSVLFKVGREITPPATTPATGQVVTAKRPEDVASEIEIMRSQHLVEQLVRELGEDFFLAETKPVGLLQTVKYHVRHTLNAAKTTVQNVMVAAGISKKLTPFEQIVASLQKNIEIEAASKSDVIYLGLKTPDPEFGVFILNKYMDLYLKRHTEVYKSVRAKSFFDTESNTWKQRVASAEANRQQFREQKKVWELNEQRQLLLRQKADLTTRHMNATADLERLNHEVAKLLELKAELPKQVEMTRVMERNRIIAAIDEQLAKLESAMEEARTRFTDESRTVSDIRGQIDRLRKARAREEQFVLNSVTSKPNETLAALEASVLEKRGHQQGLAAQRDEQARQLAAIEEELRLLDRSEVEASRRDRELARLDKNLDLYSAKLEEARISEAMDLAQISNVSVIAPATASPVPVWPNKKIWVIGGILAGLAVPLGFAFTREVVQPTARSRVEIAELAGAPVLGCIPEVRSRNAYRRWLTTGGGEPAPVTQLGLTQAQRAGAGGSSVPNTSNG